MNTIPTIFLLFLCITTAPVFSQTVKWQWAQRAGGLGSGGGGADDKAVDIAVDNEGNTYVCGTIYDSFFASFDTISVDTYGDDDMFIAKYNCEGELQWVKTSGNRQSDSKDWSAVEVDTVANYLYYLNYVNSDNIDNFYFANDTIITDPYNSFSLMQMDFDGNINWWFIAGHDPNGASAGIDISLDSLGNIYTVFTVGGSQPVPFAPGYNLSIGFYLGKFDPAGNLLWVDSLWDSGAATFNDIATDKAGNSYIVGNFQDTVQIFGQQLISSGALGDAFLAKYDAQGNYQWLKRSISTSTNFASPSSVTVDKNGIYIAGTSATGTQFGSWTINNTVGLGSTPYLVKYKLNGQVDWLHNSSGWAISDGLGCTVNNQGDVFLTGILRGSTTFGTATLNSVGQGDVYAIGYRNNGGQFMAMTLKGSGDQTDIGFCAAAGHNGNFYLAGSFGSNLQLPDDTIQSVGGNSDIFVAKYGIPECHDTTTIDTTIGIAAFHLQDHLPLLLYPNPSDGPFTIETAEAIDNAVLSLFSATGQLVYREQLNRSGRPFKRTFDPELKPGVYFVQLRDGERQYYQKLIVRQP